jgi:ribosomal protection tetracycline resistance protein
LTRRTLNLGILAHVDAGKTTLTERLLYAAGVIDEIGSVDAARRRPIRWRSSASAGSPSGPPWCRSRRRRHRQPDRHPGHPDFIAEVERVLDVLDGAVLVISAVEGVQPQTRVLMRALRRLRIPALLFVNKIDRAGGGGGARAAGDRGRLSPAVVPMGSAPGSAPARPASRRGERPTPAPGPGWPRYWPNGTRQSSLPISTTS